MEDKGLMCVLQTPLAGCLWNQPRVVGNNTLREGTGCGWKRGHREVGQQFSGTNVLVLGPGDKHNTVQHKHRNEIEKRP